ncbi:RecR protein [Candidatus Omnitrophus magneticus]|uniref:Recombination protein RecR n=1 Tax=Candidatus Omnitrophus magneticus TaxID=1609969 RepID=A0A0F0CSG9_9BACT|nr:RecR protein [Candidatus Omnitrophus magneticus]
MKKIFPPAMAALIEELTRMPGIGPRSAERITFHILQSSPHDVLRLIDAIQKVKEIVKFCKICNNLSENDFCSICMDTGRDRSKICVVRDPGAVSTIEKSGIFHGVYHVLLGELSPIDGLGPNDIKIKELVARVKKGTVSEIIIATDFTTEGETTALYLFELLKQFKIIISRLARGVPAGGMLEYVDIATLQRAFDDRRNV